MYIFGFEVNILEILLVTNAALFVLLLLVLYETRALKALVDEMRNIENEHRKESKESRKR